MKPNFQIYEFSVDSLEDIFGPTNAKLNRIDYIFKYFNKLKKLKRFNNISIVKEIDYIDKFYLRDYSRYYSQSFDGLHSHSTRIHFFSCKFGTEEFQSILESKNPKKKIINKSDKSNINDPYLGHITVKPVTDVHNSKLMGRTAFSTYPKSDGDKKRYYLTSPNHCSLFGIDLSIDSVPFQEQDIAVGACASACLWMTQFIINKWYSLPIYSLSEITELSRLMTAYSHPAPVFPSTGLTIAEIVNYIQMSNLHFHIFDIMELRSKVNALKSQGISLELEEIVEDILKAYSTTDFPIICGVKLIKNDRASGLHAVLLSGFKQDSKENIDEIYLHDDQIGPYCKTEFDGSILSWKNDWYKTDNVDEMKLIKLVIPVDPLAKLGFLGCITQYYKIKPIPYKAYFNLYHISKYKRELCTKQIKHKAEILSKNMPRFVWVLRLFENDDSKPTRDFIYDANRTLLRKKIQVVEFK